MVARLNAGKVVSFLLALCLFLAPVARASVEEGRAIFSAYQGALQARQAAAAKGDAEAYEKKGKEAQALLQESLAEFEAGNAARTMDPAIVRDYISVLRAMDDHDLAAEAIEDAIARGVEDAVLWRLLGECLLTIAPSRYPDAVEALRQSLTLDNTSPAAADTWFALGKYYLDAALPEEAARCFDQALAVHAEHVPARLGSAAAAIYAGEIRTAGDIIENVGRDAQPYDTLLRGMVRGALYDFDSARRTIEDTAPNHYAFARVLYLAARLPEAILAARRATDLDPQNKDIWNFLGAVQMQMGDYAGAQQAYEASLKIDPSQTQLADTVRQLKQAQEEAARQQQQAPPAQESAPLQGQGPLR